MADETDDGMNYNSVILDGVFLDLNQRSNINKSGLADADRATLFIPFSVKAYVPAKAETGLAIAGQAVAGYAIAGKTEHIKTYLTPKAYAALQDKYDHWTIFDGGESSGADCFFVKGVIDEEALSYAEAVRKYDFVYHVSTVDLRDFGRRRMQHWQVGGR
jgi:hypothetical protein